MTNLTPEETTELLARDDMSVYPSFDAHLAYFTRYDETPLDALIRTYYLGAARLSA